MKRFLKCIILCTAIMLIALGIHTADIIVAGIGGVFVGVYNAMTQNKE